MPLKFSPNNLFLQPGGKHIFSLNVKVQLIWKKVILDIRFSRGLNYSLINKQYIIVWKKENCLWV